MIRVIDCKKNAAVRLLIGHTRSVFDMCTHPRELNLLLSGSTDMCARIWDVSTGACLAVLGGMQGHRSGLLSVSWRFDGTRVATGSFDRSVRVWDIPQDLQQRVAKTKHPLLLHYPSYTTSWHPSAWKCAVGGDMVVRTSEGPHLRWAAPHTDHRCELEYFGYGVDRPSTTMLAPAAVDASDSMTE